VRLLLDEMYSPEIARQLRQRGHDVVSVKERTDLVALGDREILARATAEGRAILTNDPGGFVPLFHEVVAHGDETLGILLTDDRSMPPSASTIGRYVRVLDDLLRHEPADDACRNELRWLP
jgi:predicted nuclease of predicted toxin-antitoxin system